MSNTEIVRAFIAALERKDLDTALTMVTDDVEYDNVPIGKVHGPDGIRTTLEPFMAPATTIEWVIHREAETGDVVFNERLDRFEMPWGWVELAVNGVWELRDGKIALWRDYFDQPSFVAQLPGA
jgi:limonene-1,2-epoxide hydrolase